MCVCGVCVCDVCVSVCVVCCVVCACVFVQGVRALAMKLVYQLKKTSVGKLSCPLIDNSDLLGSSPYLKLS